MAKTKTTKDDFKDLAIRHYEDAEILLRYNRYNGAEYSALMSLECCFKYKIFEYQGFTGFDDNKIGDKFGNFLYTHDITDLARISGDWHDLSTSNSDYLSIAIFYKTTRQYHVHDSKYQINIISSKFETKNFLAQVKQILKNYSIL